MRQILFLDFDGVLNNVAWYTSPEYKANRASLEWKDGKARRAAGDFDPANMEQLAAIARRLPQLQVVVSSTWRLGRTLEELRDLLSPHVPPERVVGLTGRDESGLRFKEIQRWLEHNAGPVHRFLALDDDTFDMKQLGADFLHVHRDHGLTAEHTEAVVRHFSGG